MFNSLDFELKKPLNELEVKKFCYLFLKNVSANKIFVEPIDRNSITVSFLFNKNEADIKREVEAFLTSWYINEKSGDSHSSEDATKERLEKLCSCCNPANDNNIAQELITKKWIKLLNSNDMQFSREIIRLAEYFDRSYVEYVSKHYNEITEVKYSPLIPDYYIEKMNYYQTNSENFFFATHLESSTAGSFKEKCKANGGALIEDANNYIKQPSYVLQTAPCFKIYFSLENETIEKDTVYTVKGECFRNEVKTNYLLERLINFSMREFVFIGAPEFVVENRDKTLMLSVEWMKTIGLSGGCLLANDPFFIDKDKYQSFDIPTGIKYEVRAEIPYKSDTISIASFDTHGNFFSKTLNFKLANNKDAWSGCIGLGIERCVWSFLQQYGLDSCKWPERIRKAVYEG